VWAGAGEGVQAVDAGVGVGDFGDCVGNSVGSVSVIRTSMRLWSRVVYFCDACQFMCARLGLGDGATDLSVGLFGALGRDICVRHGDVVLRVACRRGQQTVDVFGC
jgi:hypothetical protein